MSDIFTSYGDWIECNDCNYRYKHENPTLLCKGCGSDLLEQHKTELKNIAEKIKILEKLK